MDREGCGDRVMPGELPSEDGLIAHQDDLDGEIARRHHGAVHDDTGGAITPHAIDSDFHAATGTGRAYSFWSFAAGMARTWRPR